MRKLVVVLFTFLPLLAFAQVYKDAPVYVRDIDYKLEQPFGGQDNISNLAEYINVVYAFALGIVGIIAVVLIMAGGLRWIAAAGNESAITDAKEIITSAVTGLAIALLSFVILSFINPQISTGRLGIPIIAIGKETSIVDLPKCDSKDFSGKTCTNPDTSTQSNCEDITCGQQGFVDGKYCRGKGCADGTGVCYRGPVDPMNYSCQNVYCGEWAENCADSAYESYSDAGNTFQSQYHACACNYYTKVTMPLFGVSPYTYSGTYAIKESVTNAVGGAAGLHDEFCSESNSQEDIISAVVNNLDSSTYSGSASSVQTRGWKCGFTSCDLNPVAVTSGDTAWRCWVQT